MITFNLSFLKKLFDWRPKPKFQDPTTFEEAVDFVATKINPNSINDPTFHFNAGMSIRNGLGLWKKETPLHQHMVNRFGLCHADDTGMLIANAANAKINGIDYDIDADIRRCKEHWLRSGLDPATMNRLNT